MEDIYEKLNYIVNKKFSWVGFVDSEDLTIDNDVFKVFLRAGASTKRQFHALSGDFKVKDRNELVNKLCDHLKPTYVGEDIGYMCNDFSYLYYRLGQTFAEMFRSDKDDGNGIEINFKTFDKNEFGFVSNILKEYKIYE